MADMSEDTPKREQADKPGPDPEVLVIPEEEAEEGLDRLLGIDADPTDGDEDDDGA